MNNPEIEKPALKKREDLRRTAISTAQMALVTI
jgi:hypothetical protein